MEVMSVLQKYARVPKTENRTKSVGTKLEEQLYEVWIELCNSLGLSSSEAVRYLIIEAIAEDTKATSSNQGYKNINEGSDDDNKSTIYEKVDTKKKKKSTKGKKTGNLTPYEVDGKLPCPVCKVFYSRKNYGRHCQRKHGVTSSYEMIQNHFDVVEKMLEEIKNGGQTDGKDTPTRITE